jgi:hypothetical protein
MTLDIKDLFVNIPIKETVDITRHTTPTQQRTNNQTDNQFATHNPPTELPYFPRTHLPAMGSPISSITAEIFLQSFEEKHLNHLIDERNIMFYTRYVDILIIYNTD